MRTSFLKLSKFVRASKFIFISSVVTYFNQILHDQNTVSKCRKELLPIQATFSTLTDQRYQKIFFIKGCELQSINANNASFDYIYYILHLVDLSLKGIVFLRDTRTPGTRRANPVRMQMWRRRVSKQISSNVRRVIKILVKQLRTQCLEQANLSLDGIMCHLIVFVISQLTNVFEFSRRSTD